MGFSTSPYRRNVETRPVSVFADKRTVSPGRPFEPRRTKSGIGSPHNSSRDIRDVVSEGGGVAPFEFDLVLFIWLTLSAAPGAYPVPLLVDSRQPGRAAIFLSRS